MEVMLDTNAYSDWVRDGLWHKQIASASKVKISTIVIGELYHGFHGGLRFAENVETLDRFLSQPIVEVVPIDREISEVFGYMIHPLKGKGITIPTNDVWIAAAAFVTQTSLLTSDSDFDHFPQVRRILLR